jgi:hypothetical protein
MLTLSLVCISIHKKAIKTKESAKSKIQNNQETFVDYWDINYAQNWLLFVTFAYSH